MTASGNPVGGLIGLALAALIGCAPIGPATAASGAETPAPANPPASEGAPASEAVARDFVLVIHGGAGTIRRGAMTPEREREIRGNLEAALRAGHEVLRDGGAAPDAVIAAIRVMEDSPNFNAGKGAVFTSAGTNELDASIMEGRTLNAGAVAGVMRVKNPIELARLVMDRSVHVMLSGEGAEAFGREQGVTMVDPEYFYTESRWRSLERAREAEAGGGGGASAVDGEDLLGDSKLGTVGAVALDRDGDLAAGTSTGGMTNKRFGRIGDSPVIGAGTYADNESCAVSATGHGEFFIRNAVAHDICARMKYAGASLGEAAEEVILRRLVAQGATGGVIALDRAGNVSMPFNTEGMYRGYIRSDGTAVVFIYGDE